MKKLQFYSGGHPLVIEDINWMQNGIIEAMAGICKSFVENITVSNTYQQSENCVILTGIDLVINTYDVTSGWAYIDGEICFVNTWTRPLNSNWSDWGLVQSALTYDPSGAKVYANNQSKDTYSIRLGEWKLISSIPQGVNYIPLEAVTEFKFKLPKSEVLDFITVVNTSTPDNYIGVNKRASLVTVNLRISDLVMNGAINYTLPTEYRPANDVMFFCPTLTFTDKYAICKITTSGSIVLTGEGFTNPSAVSTKVLGSISYYI